MDTKDLTNREYNFADILRDCERYNDKNIIKTTLRLWKNNLTEFELDIINRIFESETKELKHERIRLAFDHNYRKNLINLSDKIWQNLPILSEEENEKMDDDINRISSEVDCLAGMLYRIEEFINSFEKISHVLKTEIKLDSTNEQLLFLKSEELENEIKKYILEFTEKYNDRYPNYCFFTTMSDGSSVCVYLKDDEIIFSGRR